MAIRVIVRTDNANMAANVGGDVFIEFKTFDIDVPELETYLREKMGSFEQRQVVGVELPAPPASR